MIRFFCAALALLLASAPLSARAQSFPKPSSSTTATPTFLVDPSTGSPASSGSSSLGSVGSNEVAISVTPTVQAAAYAAGNVIGGLITLPGAARIAGGTGLVQAAGVAFVSGAQAAVDVILLAAAPTASTITDKTALAIGTADLPKVAGVIHLTDCTLLGGSAPSFCQAQQQAMPFDLVSGQALYAIVVARAAATLTSTADMTFTLQVIQN